MPTLLLHQFGDEDPAAAPGRNCAANVREVLDGLNGAKDLNGIMVHPAVPLAAQRAVAGDVVIIHGHGGDNNATISYDDDTLITAVDAVRFVQGRVPARGAGVTIYWVVCFSAMPAHVAHVCKRALPDATVYGTAEAHGGGLCATNRQGVVRAFSFAAQMVEV